MLKEAIISGVIHEMKMRTTLKQIKSSIQAIRGERKRTKNLSKYIKKQSTIPSSNPKVQERVFKKLGI